MGKRSSRHCRGFLKSSVVIFLAMTLFSTTLQSLTPTLLPHVHASAPPGSATIAPSTYWGPFFGTSGDVQVDINRPGIAVRVEIPREFLQSVISTENDTHFIQSDIRNDYYYYSVVDESNHWSYAWHGEPSDGPCFKPKFSLRDPNAPWCVEIWDYLNDPNYKASTEGVDYCAVPPPTRYVFSCFSPPKFIRFRNLNAPNVAGIYNFTIFVANRTNSMGYPDFVSPLSVWNKTLSVPVSMSNDPGSMFGAICDADAIPNKCLTILGDKGVVYATNVKTGQIARAYVNQAGQFNLTGLALGNYTVQASAGLVGGVAYSLSDPVTRLVTNPTPSTPSAPLQLHRAPQVCGSISYDASPGNPLHYSFSDNTNLKTVFGPGSDQRIKLNITVEATDSQGHVFRFTGTSSNSSSDSFFITTGSNITYVGTDPYGTEYAGLPPIPLKSGSYKLTVHIYITGYVEEESVDRSVTVQSAPLYERLPLNCGTSPGANKVSADVSAELMGGLISGEIQLRGCRSCTEPETPDQAKKSLGLPEPLFGGNILIEAYDSSGILRGVAVNGIVPSFSGGVSTYHFYVIGFSEYLNHTRSGVWNEMDYGLVAGQYSVQIFIRGYEQASSPIFQVPQGISNAAGITVRMVRGGVFQVNVGSFDNRFGTGGCTIQSKQPWRFLNLSIPIRARVYYYDSGGRLVGFNETLMKTKVNHGTDAFSFTVLFTGQNWTIREIWFYGYVPTHITNETYSIKGFTLGYVQCLPVSLPNDLSSLVRGFVALLVANEIDITAVRDDLSNITEHDHAIAEAYANGLEGALPANVSAKVPLLTLQILGFGAWENISCVPPPCKTSFLGLGHFFYVSPDGARYFDYGLGVGEYTAEVPEFGFNSLTSTVSQHFESSPLTASISFKDLFLEQGFVIRLLTMAMVYFSGTPGVAAESVDGILVPLSWVQVTAANANFSRSVSTLDGQYSGVGALFLPAGTYNVSFSVPFYLTQTTSISLGWGDAKPLLPPDCDYTLSTTCDPPSTLPLSPANPQFPPR